jgi:hypothetical protein
VHHSYSLSSFALLNIQLPWNPLQCKHTNFLLKIDGSVQLSVILLKIKVEDTTSFIVLKKCHPLLYCSVTTLQFRWLVVHGSFTGLCLCLICQFSTYCTTHNVFLFICYRYIYSSIIFQSLYIFKITRLYMAICNSIWILKLPNYF